MLCWAPQQLRIPVLALAYLAMDRDRFLLGRGIAGYTPDVIGLDTRLRDLEAEAESKEKPAKDYDLA